MGRAGGWDRVERPTSRLEAFDGAQARKAAARREGYYRSGAKVTRPDGARVGRIAPEACRKGAVHRRKEDPCRTGGRWRKIIRGAPVASALFSRSMGALRRGVSEKW
jgi:hypothetical protein